MSNCYNYCISFRTSTFFQHCLLYFCTKPNKFLCFGSSPTRPCSDRQGRTLGTSCTRGVPIISSQLTHYQPNYQPTRPWLDNLVPRVLSYSETLGTRLQSFGVARIADNKPRERRLSHFSIKQEGNLNLTHPIPLEALQSKAYQQHPRRLRGRQWGRGKV